MGNLLLNSLVGLHARAFRDLKKERPDQINLLVRWQTHRSPTVMAHQQATCAKKFMLQNATFLQNFMKIRVKRA